MIAPNELHIHLVATIDAGGSQECHLRQSVLSEAERARASEISHARRRAEFIAGRALIRTRLSHYLGGDPQRWNIVLADNEKPFLAVDGASGLVFNLSHTAGLLVCAFGVSGAIGVDVENIFRASSLATIAKRFFAPGEIEQLARQKEDALRKRFFEIWTLKEAVIKARGWGLPLPLAKFECDFSKAGVIGLSFNNTLEELASNWSVWSLAPTPEHRVAAAWADEKIPYPNLRVFWGSAEAPEKEDVEMECSAKNF